LTGKGGLLAQLTKRLVKSALEGEITDHLGYGPPRTGRRRILPQPLGAGDHRRVGGDGLVMV
jgi:hypothetical protein